MGSEKNNVLVVDVEKNTLVEEELGKVNKKYGEAVGTNKILMEELNLCHMQNEKLLLDRHKMAEHESILNKSIDELEFNNETTSLHIQKLEEVGKTKQSGYEKMTSKLESVIVMLKRDIQNTRRELSDQRKEMSILKQDNLKKEFKIQELKRYLREKNVDLPDMTKSI